MTVKEKAIRLFDDFRYRSPGTPEGKSIAKDHALFCCDEVIAEIEDLQQNCVMEFPMALDYWKKVKEHITSL